MKTFLEHLKAIVDADDTNSGAEPSISLLYRTIDEAREALKCEPIEWFFLPPSPHSPSDPMSQAGYVGGSIVIGEQRFGATFSSTWKDFEKFGHDFVRMELERQVRERLAYMRHSVETGVLVESVTT